MCASLLLVAISEKLIYTLLIFQVCSNIAQLAYLNATHQNVNIVFFTGELFLMYLVFLLTPNATTVGGFVRDNALLWNKLSESISYWSKGKMKVKHCLSLIS